MRFSVTLLILPPEACDTTSAAWSRPDQCLLKAAPVPRDSARFSSPYCPHPATEISRRLISSRTPKPASVIDEKLQAIASRVREKKHMAAFRIAAQMIAYQPVEAIEVLAHVSCASRHVDPRRRSKPEHRLHPVQYGQQAFQRLRIEATIHFDSTPASQLNSQHAIVSLAVCMPRRR